MASSAHDWTQLILIAWEYPRQVQRENKMFAIFLLGYGLGAIHQQELSNSQTEGWVNTSLLLSKNNIGVSSNCIQKLCTVCGPIPPPWDGLPSKTLELLAGLTFCIWSQICHCSRDVPVLMTNSNRCHILLQDLWDLLQDRWDRKRLDSRYWGRRVSLITNFNFNITKSCKTKEKQLQKYGLCTDPPHHTSAFVSNSPISLTRDNTKKSVIKWVSRVLIPE